MSSLASPQVSSLDHIHQADPAADVLQTHPAYKRLKDADGLFHDPFTGGPATQNIWASGIADAADGSWVDLTAKGAREWWCEGVAGLVKLGCDGMWE